MSANPIILSLEFHRGKLIEAGIKFLRLAEMEIQEGNKNELRLQLYRDAAHNMIETIHSANSEAPIPSFPGIQAYMAKVEAAYQASLPKTSSGRED